VTLKSSKSTTTGCPLNGVLFVSPPSTPTPIAAHSPLCRKHDPVVPGDAQRTDDVRVGDADVGAEVRVVGLAGHRAARIVGSAGNGAAHDIFYAKDGAVDTIDGGPGPGRRDDRRRQAS
jgi:hypothetical protein